MLAAVTVTLPNIGEGEAIVSVEKSLFISIVFKLKIFVLANTGGGTLAPPAPQCPPPLVGCFLIYVSEQGQIL